MITIAVGFGLIISFFLFELLGLTPGGLVVPGFLALELHEPVKLLITVVLSIITYLTTKLLSNFMLLYDRRHLIVSVLAAFLLGEIFNRFPVVCNSDYQLQGIGFILPGLIAYWMEAQGLVRTLCSMLISASLIHLLLDIITGGRFILW